MIVKRIREDIEYNQKFGMIPDDLDARIESIYGTRKSRELVNSEVNREIKRISRIKWHTLKFTMWKVVKPSMRPRANTRGGYVQMYVPHAKENGDWFANFAKENNLPIIDKPCQLNITIYERTPTTFSMKNKLLSELGFIRPWRRSGDFDNYAKAVADMIQHGCLADDCLVIDSIISRRFSIKPHTDVEIKYMDECPFEFTQLGGKDQP